MELTDQPPFKRRRLTSAELPSDSSVVVNANKIENRLTIHDTWVMDSRPLLVEKARSRLPQLNARPPLQKYGVQVMLPIGLNQDDVNLELLLQTTAGYLNLSYTDQLPLVWKHIDEELDEFTTNQKNNFDIESVEGEDSPKAQDIDPAALLRFLTDGTITKRDVEDRHFQQTMFRLRNGHFPVKAGPAARYFYFAHMFLESMERFKAGYPQSLKLLGVDTIFSGPYSIVLSDYGLFTRNFPPVWEEFATEDIFRFYMLWKAYDVLKARKGKADRGKTILPDINRAEVILPFFSIRPPTHDAGVAPVPDIPE
ncbi:hypothetical protein M409DRAFT_31233 [Zasmidium cellare ATCC 36951]|uniref:Uncharacterized protein n=1 Tax=Zasmidium cellare ATCC 36951 TaxID=1080233 RepID=A0A6A6BTZ8_ZASCE|nr:uncharacterized protein M409DRAFT_31233 [Zasmidium cellare ATCC 36951]KAF2158284.1 hypothetical protein M409DRAFT_31233 [Zasmidium cellare ATCC 36951]